MEIPRFLAFYTITKELLSQYINGLCVFEDGLFNNREIATITWLLMFLGWSIYKATIRSSLYGLLKSLFQWKIITIISFMLIYVAFIVEISVKSGFWDTGLIKNTIYWTFGVAFLMLMQINKTSNDAYFSKAIADNFKLVLLFEFIVNFYTFSLLAELIIVPLITMTVMVMTYAECYSDDKPEYKHVQILLSRILVIYVFSLMTISLYNIASDFQNFATLKNFRNFLLPPLFSIAYLPFLYLTALLMKYETTFIRIDINNDDLEFSNYIKRKTLVFCHVNLRKLNAWSKELLTNGIRNKDEVLELMRKLSTNKKW